MRLGNRLYVDNELHAALFQRQPDHAAASCERVAFSHQKYAVPARVDRQIPAQLLTVVRKYDLATPRVLRPGKSSNRYRLASYTLSAHRIIEDLPKRIFPN